MFKLMGKEINTFLGAKAILIWTYELYVCVNCVISIFDCGLRGRHPSDVHQAAGLKL